MQNRKKTVYGLPLYLKIKYFALPSSQEKIQMIQTVP